MQFLRDISGAVQGLAAETHLLRERCALNGMRCHRWKPPTLSYMVGSLTDEAVTGMQCACLAT